MRRLIIKSLFFIYTTQATNLQTPQTFYAPNLYGDIPCTEHEKRFDSQISDKNPHNQDFPNSPEKWLCGFCDADLYNVVQRVCCGEDSRKRREAEVINFWHSLGTSDAAAHPDQMIKRKMNSDCLDDIKNKHRITRDTGADTNSTSWYSSIENGGKGRSTVNEILDKITCSKENATDFLGSGNKRDRSIWKHTYIQQECCGIGSNGKDCLLDEIQQSYLQEECCGEGCRLEEIHEDCGAWRWDMYEGVEEETHL